MHGYLISSHTESQSLSVVIPHLARPGDAILQYDTAVF